MVLQNGQENHNSNHKTDHNQLGEFALLARAETRAAPVLALACTPIPCPPRTSAHGGRSDSLEEGMPARQRRTCLSLEGVEFPLAW